MQRWLPTLLFFVFSASAFCSPREQIGPYYLGVHPDEPSYVAERLFFLAETIRTFFERHDRVNRERWAADKIANAWLNGPSRVGLSTRASASFKSSDDQLSMSALCERGTIAPAFVNVHLADQEAVDRLGDSLGRITEEEARDLAFELVQELDLSDHEYRVVHSSWNGRVFTVMVCPYVAGLPMLMSGVIQVNMHPVLGVPVAAWFEPAPTVDARDAEHLVPEDQARHSALTAYGACKPFPYGELAQGALLGWGVPAFSRSINEMTNEHIAYAMKGQAIPMYRFSVVRSLDEQGLPTALQWIHVDARTGQAIAVDFMMTMGSGSSVPSFGQPDAILVGGNWVPLGESEPAVRPSGSPQTVMLRSGKGLVAAKYWPDERVLAWQGADGEVVRKYNTAPDVAERGSFGDSEQKDDSSGNTSGGRAL